MGVCVCVCTRDTVRAWSCRDVRVHLCMRGGVRSNLVGLEPTGIKADRGKCNGRMSQQNDFTVAVCDGTGTGDRFDDNPISIESEHPSFRDHDLVCKSRL